MLDGYEFCGDYAGFAQIDLESRYPSAQAMFVAGCGADQNPIPRGVLALSSRKAYAETPSCIGSLAGQFRSIKGPLDSKYGEIALAFAPLPSRDEIERDTKSSNFYTASRARLLLETINRRGSLEKTYPYPVQVWRLGDLTWIFLGGEVVVDYSLRIKRNLGSSATWLRVATATTHGLTFPSKPRARGRGGYEGGGAML